MALFDGGGDEGEIAARRQKTEAARKAGYRGAAVEVNRELQERIDQLGAVNVHAPRGYYADLDSVLNELLSAKKISSHWLDELEMVPTLWRSMFFGNVRVCLEMAVRHETVFPQGRRDFRQIDGQVFKLRKHIAGFLEHVDTEIAGLFVSRGEFSDAEMEGEKDMALGAEQRLLEVHEALKVADSALDGLMSRAERPAYDHAGNADRLVNWFLKGCSNAWSLMTGESPSKTANGRFVRACVGAWQMFGWPLPDGKDLHSLFEFRLKRGVHLSQ